LAVAVVLTLFAMALLLAVGFASVAVVRDAAVPSVAEQDPLLVARRVISIPFGIDASVPIVEDGDAVVVSGHGVCPEGAESYRLRVEVDQPSTGTRAMGVTEGDCVGGTSLTWQAMAMTPPPFAFSPGPAQACAMVQLFFSREGTIVHQWCVDVTLQ
ncbi:MAG TPA: hypothetical protein VLC95_19410, partial [Anaerolineae bacterium]|nr:hypothetical protein [Anaerolineae bacterium]